MPFIRHLRDKRGYETTVVMHGYRPHQQGPQRTRVLYLFRSPSHIKFGRRALDEESREALEHTHPDLSFDWNALGRESAAMRAEDSRDRDRDRDRDRGGRHSRQAPQAPRPPAQPARVVVEDHSVLGRALGADEAARLRAAYTDLVQRVTRRARTPEERDRLIERAQRLNPDDWPDDATVRAMAGTVDTDRDAILAELPSRRRGRRGGRRRDRGEETGGAPGEAGPAADADDSSEIMAEEGEFDATAESDALARHDAPAGDRPVDRGAGAGDNGPAGDGLPDDNELRPDVRHRS